MSSSIDDAHTPATASGHVPVLLHETLELLAPRGGVKLLDGTFGVLHLQGGTVGHQSAIRQTDTQRGADLGALDGVAVVVLTVYVAGEHEVVLEDFESFPRDHVNSKKCISH